jgi:anti-anti-sigma factor
MDVKNTEWNGWNVLTIVGEFVVKNLMLIREQLDAIEKAGCKKVAFDLEKVTYIDSSAITLLLNYHKKTAAKNVCMVIFGASEDVKSIFSIVGLDNSIKLYASREAFEKSTV